ncbi:MAG: type VI secretion system tip protein VgrG [Myxococcales bacterium]|nr:type VI secretion system tip protein VgrG [Myxococcales bacterium]
MASPPDSSESLVRYSFWCPESPDTFVVERFEATETLGRPYEIRLVLTAEEDSADTPELLGRDVQILLERGDHQRVFAGIVAGVSLLDDAALRQTGVVIVRPALSALRLTNDTRIFQDQNAVAILAEVLAAALAPYGREADLRHLDPTRYATREYCVQYRETTFDFVHRLMEEEGLGYFFEHGDREVMHLFSASRDLPPVATWNGEAVRFDPIARAVGAEEPVTSFRPKRRLASTGLTTRDHDWTRTRPKVEASRQSAPQALERAHEVYEHGIARHLTITEDAELLATLIGLAQSAAMPFGLPMGIDRRVADLKGPLLDGFTSNDVEHRAQVGHERLRRDARTVDGESWVTGFTPGRRFQLLEHPTLGADGDYLLTKVVHESAVPDQEGSAGHNYINRFECIPLDVPWRPLRETRKPRVYGVQTARVTGPVGLDVYTDQHGRIKVKLAWDRAPDDPAGNHTCWIRVSQSWAGDNAPGFLFIPRVGMEVVVAFVDGDPDRPLVTGCVYNGANPTPAMLPFEATKSIIRTRTVPHGVGYNELSFEDAMGMERVHLRAQRDLDELVLQDHRAVVQRNQLSEVAGERAEHTGGSHVSEVGGDRIQRTDGDLAASVMGSERRVVAGSLITEVGRSETISIERGSRVVRVMNGEQVLISHDRTLLSQGGENHLVMHTNGDAEGPKGVFVETPHAITLKAGEATITMNADGSGGIQIDSPSEITLTVGSSTLKVSPNAIQANKKTMPT